MTTHMTIAHRTLAHMWTPATYSSYGTLLTSEVGALMAGAPFPDYLYECGTDHNAGEYAHWAPFQSVAATYIRSEYPQPWNDTAEGLVAFMHGVVSHYIADLNWHGMGNTATGYGLIETIGGMDFNCTGGIVSRPCGNGSRDMGDPHTMADTGGEFIASYAVSLDGWDDPNTWYVPTQDLLNIYAMANITVNASAIEECAAIFYAGTVLIRYLGWLVEPLVINDSPTFAEQYVDMPCGGVDDMAQWSGHMWNRWEAWLEQGPPAVTPVNVVGPEPRGSAVPDRAGLRAMKILLRALAPLAFDAALLEVMPTHGRGGMLVQTDAVSSGAAARMLKGLRRMLTESSEYAHNLRLRVDKVLSEMRPPRDSQPMQRGGKQSWTSATARDFDMEALAGDLLAVLRIAGLRRIVNAVARKHSQATATKQLLAVLDIVEGAHDPPSTRTEAPPTTGNGTTQLTPVAIFASSSALEYAGASLSVGDFDADGYDDVVMTAYGHTAMGSAPNGAVITSAQAGGYYVRYGNMSLDAQPAAFPVPMPDYATFGNDVFTRFGWDACVLDFNADGVDDLAVSAPTYGWVASWTTELPYSPAYMYWGRVMVFFGVKGQGLVNTSPDVVIATTINNTYMGMHLGCGDVSGDGFDDLIVGSPMALTAVDQVSDWKDAAQRGRVDVFFSSAKYQATPVGLTLDLASAANYSANGSTPYQWLGYSSRVLGNISLPSSAYLTGSDSGAAAHGYRLRACGVRAAADLQATTSPGSLLFVSSPGYRATQSDGGYAAVGRIAAYAIPAVGSQADELIRCMTGRGAQFGGASPLPAPLFTFTGSESLSQLVDVSHVISSKFGASFDIGFPNSIPRPGASPVMVVGIPDTDGDNSSGWDGINTAAGAVAVLPLAYRSLRGDYNWTTLASSAQAVLFSALADARFGMHVQLDDVTGDGIDDLLVGAPMYSPGFFMGGTETPRRRLQGFDLGHEKGAVFVYNGGSGFVHGTITHAEAAASARADGTIQYGRLGSALAVADMNADGKNELVAAAPRATEVLPSGDTPETAGAVYVYQV